MKMKSKQFLSILLSVLIILSVLPVTVFAGGGDCSITGTFTYEDGSPVVNQTVSLRDEEKNVLKTTTTDSNGVFTFVACVKSTEYYITVDEGPAYASDDEYSEDEAYYSFTAAEENTFFKGGSTRVLKPKIGSVTLTKYRVGSETIVLKDAEYELYKGDDTYIDTFTTNSNGKITVANLYFGEYYFLEKTAPSGYELDTSKASFWIANHGEDVKVDVYDCPLCSVTIKKTDAADTNTVLANAEFELFDSNGVSLGKKTTDSTGVASFEGLKAGTYTVVETKAPENYTIDTTEYPVELTYLSPDAVINATNTHYPTVTFSKVDSQTHEFLKGAKLKVLDASKNVVKTFDTLDAVTSISLAPGKYTLVEETAPAGYCKSADEPFEVKKGENLIVTMEDAPTSVTLYKYLENDKGSKEHTSGETVRTYAETGDIAFDLVSTADKNVVYTITTQVGGATITGIPMGSYKVVEKNCPDMYTAESDENIIITVSENNPNVMLDVFNNYKTFPVTFVKTDTSGNPMTASFNLAGSFDTDIDFEAGEKTIVLRPGYYVLSETTPSGYATLADKLISLTTDGDLYIESEKQASRTVTIKNAPITVSITKYDSETYNLIAGAKLQLSKDDDSYSKIFETSNTPTILTAELTPGAYTLKELEAPTGYDIADPVKFTVADTGDTQYVSMADEKLFGTVFIYKTGDDLDQWDIRDNAYSLSERFVKFMQGTLNFFSKSLKDVEFKIYAAKDIKHPDGVSEDYYKEGDLVRTITTDKNGAAMADDLPYGEYKVIETKTGDNYLIDSTPRIFTIDDVHGVKSPVMHNYYNEAKKVVVNVHKKDAISTAPLKGVVFGLYNTADIKNSDGTATLVAADSLLGTLETNADGYATLSITVPLGQYYLKEIKTIDGYVPSTTKTPIDFTKNYSNFALNQKETVYDFTIKNSPTSIKINKIDAVDGKNVVGAHLQLLDSKSNIVKEWDTTNEPAVFYAIPAGTYTLKETSAPVGYVAAADKTITIQNISTVQEYTMTDDRISGTIVITKTNVDGQPLKGVHFTIKNKATDGKIGEYITDIDGKCEITVPVAVYENGKVTKNIEYTVEETITLPGYIKNNEVKNVTFNFTDSNIENYKTNKFDLSFVNDYTKISITKLDNVSNTKLGNAKLSLYPDTQFDTTTLKLIENAVPMFTWTSSDSTAFTANMVPAGNYLLVEETAPDGYLLATSKVIQVLPISALQEYEIKNDYTKISISKIDRMSHEFVRDAQLALFKASDCDKDGYPLDGAKPVSSWTSSTSAEDFVKLAPGNYYIFEANAPAGYVVSRPLLITVKASAEKQNFEFENDFTRVKISKLDKDTHDYVTNAFMALYAENDVENKKIKESATPIVSWITGAKSFYIEKLPVGNYYVVEKSAPSGYLICEPELITVAKTANLQTFVVYDDFTKVEISKIDTETKELLADVKLNLYAEGDYDDNLMPIDGAVPYKAWTTTDNSQYFERLPVGNYLLFEEATVPGYVFFDSKIITIEEISDLQTFTVENDFTRISILKVDAAGVALPDGSEPPLAGCTLALYSKEDCDENGRPLNNTTPVQKWVSGDEAQTFTKVVPGEYYIVELDAPKGYLLSEPQLITIKSIADNQEFVIRNYFTHISISKTDYNGELLGGAELALYQFEDIDKNSKVVKNAQPISTWISSEEMDHIETKLIPGKYYIVENKAPEGYVKCDPVLIEVKATSNTQTFTVKNDFTKVKIAKVDKETGKHLSGADFDLYKEDELKEYINNILNFILDNFALPENPTNEDILNMFEKITETSSENILKKIKVPQPVASWTSFNEDATFEKLPVGNYVLIETYAPEGYAYSKSDYDITRLINKETIKAFNFDETDEVNATFTLIEVKETTDEQRFVIENDYIKVEILKIDDVTGKNVEGAHLALYEKGDINEDGEPIKGAKPVETWVSTKEPHRFNKLPAGEYVLIETEAPDGYVLGKAATIKVTNSTSEVQLFKYSNVKIELEEIDPEPIPKTGAASPAPVITILLMLAILFLLVEKKHSIKNK